MNYEKLAFTDAVKQLQEAHGSREAYEKMENFSSTEGLSLKEIGLIESQDHFFLASIGENGFPYIQHRGGPKGFLKVIDAETLAFLDFTGNKQYISVGNLETNNKVSLILLDYPRRTRIKIYAEAETLTLEENPELTEKLSIGDYRHRPERIMLFKVKAFAWNCPQHITPRFTVEEVEQILESQRS